MGLINFKAPPKLRDNGSEGSMNSSNLKFNLNKLQNFGQNKTPLNLKNNGAMSMNVVNTGTKQPPIQPNQGDEKSD